LVHDNFTSDASLRRKLRVGAIVQRALAEIMAHGDIKDQFFDNCIISISEVRMSSDLRIATAFVVPIPTKDNKETIVNKLKLHTKQLRILLSRKVSLKFSPDIRFKLDTRFEDSARMFAILDSEKQRSAGSQE